jgi:serine/threonine protein kinase
MREGTVLGHYRIVRALGKGGMGEVYLADDTKLKREVAVKVLPASLRDDSERLRLFRREAEAAARLKHPSIATIHALEELESPDADGEAVTFIAMEYVEGKTLAEAIPSGGMSLETFFDIFLPLADALAHAHELGRTHRDLKPANIMLNRDGTPKILDFGLARVEPEQAELSTDSESPTRAPRSLVDSGQLVGTPAYMSPEQAERKPVDARTDLFSLGVVMYEALTGERPFRGESLESLIGRILEAEPEPVTAVNPATPYLLWSFNRPSNSSSMPSSENVTAYINVVTTRGPSQIKSRRKCSERGNPYKPMTDEPSNARTPITPHWSMTNSTTRGTRKRSSRPSRLTAIVTRAMGKPMTSTAKSHDRARSSTKKMTRIASEATVRNPSEKRFAMAQAYPMSRRTPGSVYFQVLL